MTEPPPPMPPPLPPPVPPVPPERPPLEYIRADVGAGSNTPAMASFVCALLLFVPYAAGIAAVVLARKGLSRAADLGGRGRGLARTGFVLGVINICLWVLLTIAAVPVTMQARQRASQVKCASNMRQLSMAMTMYTAENKGFVPPNLDACIGRYMMGGAAACTCPEAAHHAAPPASSGAYGNYSYVYVPPPVARMAQIRSPASVVAAYEPLANHGGRGSNFVYWDGHVEWHGTARAQQLIAQVQATQAVPPALPPRRPAPPAPTTAPPAVPE